MTAGADPLPNRDGVKRIMPRRGTKAQLPRVSATELLLAENRVPDETRRAAARMVRLLGETCFGSAYDGVDILGLDGTARNEMLEKHFYQRIARKRRFLTVGRYVGFVRRPWHRLCSWLGWHLPG